MVCIKTATASSTGTGGIQPEEATMPKKEIGGFLVVTVVIAAILHYWGWKPSTILLGLCAVILTLLGYFARSRVSRARLNALSGAAGVLIILLALATHAYSGDIVTKGGIIILVVFMALVLSSKKGRSPTTE